MQRFIIYADIHFYFIFWLELYISEWNVEYRRCDRWKFKISVTFTANLITQCIVSYAIPATLSPSPASSPRHICRRTSRILWRINSNSKQDNILS